MGDFIAEGSFGKVFKGLLKSKGSDSTNKLAIKEVAIKMISKDRLKDDEIEVLVNEIEILKVCDHPNVIRLQDYFEDHQTFYLVLDLLTGDDLHKNLTKFTK